MSYYFWLGEEAELYPPWIYSRIFTAQVVKLWTETNSLFRT